MTQITLTPELEKVIERRAKANRRADVGRHREEIYRGDDSEVSEIIVCTKQ